MNCAKWIWICLFLSSGWFLGLAYQEEHDHHGDESETHQTTNHEDEDEHADEGIVHLEKFQLENLKLGEAIVKHGMLQETLALAAEVRFIPQKIVHLTPRVPGIVADVFVTQGDWVRKGQVLALIESRDLGSAKSAYLAARARVSLYEETYKREQRLWERKISPEQDYLQAKNDWQESLIEANEKRQALQVLGLNQGEIDQLAEGKTKKLTEYTFRAPFDGVISDLHISRGEFLSHESAAFVIVDPKQVWIVGQVHEKNLHRVHIGQNASVSMDAYPDYTPLGRVDYIGSSLNNETRSAEARVVVPNEDGRLKEGMFARLTLFSSQKSLATETFLVPMVSIQRSDRAHMVFKVVGEGRFQSIPVTVVNQTKDYAEVRGDLHEGDRLATGDIFILKSELGKESLGSGHSH